MDQNVYLQLETGIDNLYPALFQCFTIILCGYIAGRLNIVSTADSKGISTLVGTFALPSLIFLSLAQMDFSKVNWTFLGAILLAKSIVFFAVIVVTMLTSKPLSLGRAGIFGIFCTQSNNFALGYPIINALYKQTHPDYALYIYLMAPISLAILNPVAFVLMEIHRQREQAQAIDAPEEPNSGVRTIKLMRQITKGIAFNPVMIVTVLGIIGSIAFKRQLSIYIEGLLKIFGQSFSANALFLLGLKMVGQIHRLKGPALILPCVLIMVKMIVLPVVMRESVCALDAGSNESETLSLSTYAFLYGTIPTTPAVFVFSHLYQLEIDLMASSMVICTFLSGPMMFVAAHMITINTDYAVQLKRFGFDLSTLALIASIWVLLVFVLTKKYERMPHRLTLCLNMTQLLLASSVIWGGPRANQIPSWHATFQQAVRIFSMYSCLMWTSMLSVGILMLEMRGSCFLAKLWPVFGLVAWGGPAVITSILVVTKGDCELECKATAVRLCLLFFCITVTSGCLILYIRFRRRSAPDANLAPPSSLEERTSLVFNAEGTSSIATNESTSSPSNQNTGAACCSNDLESENGLNNSPDVDDLGSNIKECTCPLSHKHRCNVPGARQYLDEPEHAASHLGLLPPEQTPGKEAQLLKHTVLIIVYSLSMFIGITYTTWRMMLKDESGVYIEIEFVDVVANYGQALIMFILFGLDPSDVLIPSVKYLKNKWNEGVTVELPAIEDLSLETRHVCDQFITNHFERCKKTIAKDTRWRMAYRGAFRGTCLVRWLIGCGLAKDEHEAEQYGRHLLDGRLIAHVNDAHHFTNSQLLYTFK